MVENKGKLIITEIFPSVQNMIFKSVTYFMSQQPLKSLDRPLMSVSLSNSIFSITYFLLEAERVVGDKSIAS